MSESGTNGFANDPRLKVILEYAGKELERRINPPFGEPTMGFMIAVFPFGNAKGRVNYITNLDEPDIPRFLLAQLSEFSQ